MPGVFKALIAALGLALALPALAASSIDMGDASVLSQQGQRLKIAVPYGAAPSEKVPVLRFNVAQISVPEGHKAPLAENFTISKPEHRNVIYLQSREPVTAPRLQLVLSVADNAVSRVAYDLDVPPSKFAQSPTATKVTLSRKPVVRKRPVRKAAAAAAGATKPSIGEAAGLGKKPGCSC